MPPAGAPASLAPPQREQAESNREASPVSAPKKKTLAHRNRRKTARLRAMKKAKHRRVRLRRTRGDRSTYR